MKKDIHPNQKETKIKCACGKAFSLESTREDIEVEICSNCHPFYTGKEKIVDKMGRVEKFKKKMEQAEKEKKAKEKKLKEKKANKENKKKKKKKEKAADKKEK